MSGGGGRFEKKNMQANVLAWVDEMFCRHRSGLVATDLQPPDLLTLH
jgi:hypothetical protein